ADTFAMSGPGFGYYPTSLLAPGTTVTVTGEKQGDWIKILPPSDSFSWIPAASVKERDDGAAVVIEDDVKVRVGSALTDAHYVFQVTLKKDDIVQILDQSYLPEKGEIGAWFKI